MRTAVALGSNLGDRLANLRSARTAIFAIPGVSAPMFSSAIYETEPVGCEPGAGKFLNAVVEFEYEGNAEALLSELIEIEESLGRSPDHATNLSRTIDLDLLYCDDLRVENENLRLPHPRTQIRRFVLQPLADIHPELVLPGQMKTVGDLLASLEGSATLKRLSEKW